MAKALNPGGIKYRGTGAKIKAMDDCYNNGKKIPCDFQAFSSYNAMVQGWADVLKSTKVQELQKVYVSKVQQRHECKADSRCYL
jgi:flagellum-specific peptidoglycan hydrolase FlgJ